MLTIRGLRHQKPSPLLTFQIERSPSKLIGRDARRMIIENNIRDGIDFISMDALLSTMALKVDCDLQSIVMP